jgi:peptidyl-prolyl cis-trans isomerase A (cyclophilin A)
MSTLAQGALASEIVRVDTDTGSFVLEMYADIAPVTVANFLSYVNSGAYENTIIHRKVTNFVVQGGGFFYNPELGDISGINVGPAIVNEFNRSNTRGTIAMAKVSGDPNSATSQWFINLGDNSAELDSQNGGFTVFGKVLGTGMSAVDAVGALQTVNVTGVMSFSDVPILSLSGNTIADADFVNVSMTALSTSSKFDSGKLSVALNAGAIGQAWVDFALTQSTTEAIITLIPSNTLFIDKVLENMATFDALTGTLSIPELELNGEVAYTNVVFKLTDSKTYSFTLQSFDAAP